MLKVGAADEAVEALEAQAGIICQNDSPPVRFGESRLPSKVHFTTSGAFHFPVEEFQYFP
jgi:hypothetical protein